MHQVGQWLWYGNLAASAVLVVRMAVAGFSKLYPFLFSYFVVEIVGSMIMLQIPLHSNSYALTYMCYQGALHVSAILAVLEVYRIALAPHPGLARFGRAGFLTVTLSTVTLAGIGILLDTDILSGQSVVVHRFFTLERSLDLIILLFLLLISAFITWFPVKLSRTAVLSVIGFSAYYFMRAAGLLAANLLPAVYLSTVSDVLLGISFLFLLAWAAVLRWEPAEPDSRAGRSLDTAALARVSRQLDAINSALTRFARH